MDYIKPTFIGTIIESLLVYDGINSNGSFPFGVKIKSVNYHISIN